MTRNSENPLTICRTKGFTLIEVVAATALLAGLLALASLAWSGAFKRMQKSRQMKQAVILLEQKMNELESLYKGGNRPPPPEKEEGVFPENKNFTWRYETRPFTLPDAITLLKLQQLPQNDMNIKVTGILKEILSQSVLELKLTIIFKEKTERSLTSYFVNYRDASAKVFAALSNIISTGGPPSTEGN